MERAAAVLACAASCILLGCGETALRPGPAPGPTVPGLTPAPTPTTSPANRTVNETWAQYLASLREDAWSEVGELFDPTGWNLLLLGRDGGSSSGGSDALPQYPTLVYFLAFCEDTVEEQKVDMLDLDPTMVSYGYSVWKCTWRGSKYVYMQTVLFDSDSNLIKYVFTRPWSGMLDQSAILNQSVMVHSTAIQSSEDKLVQSALDLLVSAWEAKNRTAFLGLFTADARVVLYDAMTDASSEYTELGDCWDHFFAKHDFPPSATAIQQFAIRLSATAGAIGTARVKRYASWEEPMIATLAVRTPEPGVVKISRLYPVWFG